MKSKTVSVLTILLFTSCLGNTENNSAKFSQIPIVGTWKLITGKLIEKNDTVTTDYTKNISFIKIINDTHFSFLQHDLHKGKDSGAVFSSGGGSYSLNDSVYTEHLDYCSDRQWEGNSFKFVITIKNDTLTQSGIEKVERAGIDRINIETYVRLKK